MAEAVKESIEIRWRATTLTLGLLVGSAGVHGTATASPPSCVNAAAVLNDDYSFIIGSADYSDPDSDVESGSTFRWLVNDAPFSEGSASELLLLSLDGSVSGSGQEAPLVAEGIAYDTGRWGFALALQSGGRLGFAREGNLNLTEGTIEMWIALRAPGDDPIYGFLQLIHADFLFAAACGKKRCFIDHVGQVSPDKSRCPCCDDFEINILIQPDLFRMHGQDILPSPDIRTSDNDLPVKSSRS